MSTKKTQVMILTAAMAASYGIGEADFTGEAKAGQEMSRPMEYKKAHATDEVKGLTVAQVVSIGCAKIDTENGLTGDDVCTIADLYKIYLQPNWGGDPEQVYVQIGARKLGMWTP